MMTPPKRLKTMKKMLFHCAAFCRGWRSRPTMAIAEAITSIHPSKDTISNRMSIDDRNESKE